MSAWAAVVVAAPLAWGAFRIAQAYRQLALLKDPASPSFQRIYLAVRAIPPEARAGYRAEVQAAGPARAARTLRERFPELKAWEGRVLAGILAKDPPPGSEWPTPADGEGG